MTEALARNLEKIVDFREVLVNHGAPATMVNHPGVRLDIAERILEELEEQRAGRNR